MQNGKIAIVIPGLLRHATENEAALKAISGKYDVFVCTNKEQAQFLPHLGAIKSVCYVENDLFQANFERKLLALDEGRKLPQWHKLYLAYLDVVKFESAQNREYDAIFKIRTDFQFNGRFELPDLKAGDEHNFYMQSDLIFGGARSAFAQIADFIFPAILTYYGNPFYIKTNALKIAKGDFDKLLLKLKWPANVFRDQYSDEEMWRLIIENAARISVIETGQSDVYVRNKVWLKHKFRSPTSFLHYVLSKDLIAKSISATTYELVRERSETDIQNPQPIAGPAHPSAETWSGGAQRKLKRFFRRMLRMEH